MEQGGENTAQHNNKFVDFQSSAKFFFDSSSHCFDQCIKGFESKEMTPAERACTNECFTKQMVVYGSLVSTLTANDNQLK